MDRQADPPEVKAASDTTSPEQTTKNPPSVPEKAATKKIEPHRPEIPQIPGVGQDSNGEPRGFGFPDSLTQVGPLAAVALCIAIAAFWWIRSKPQAHTDMTPARQEAAEPSAPAPVPPPPKFVPVLDNSNVAATTDELAKPWSSKKFVYKRPFTGESVSGMVIRLPEGTLWAFSLNDPYSHCELEYVTDLEKLATQYGYHATHPMVGSPCKGTVYDPLKVGPIGGDTWARGEIVKGSALRPPLSIDVKESDRSIIADSME